MKAFALNDFDAAPEVQDVPVPEPAAGQIRVRVKAAALNAFDAAVASGMVRGMAEYEFPVVIGRDAAGVVDAIGDGVDDVSIGDEVLGHVLFSPPLHEGTIAEYAILPTDGIVAKPTSLDFTEAAALPLAGAAALAALDAAGVSQGQSVLIAGATGGVGSYAVQLAAARGATVIATGLPEDEQRLKALGAATVVDYREDVAAAVAADYPEGVDALIDLVTFDAESFSKLAKAVRPDGKVASTTGGATPEALQAAGLTGQTVRAHPNRDTLGKLLAEVERGTLRIDVQRVISLDDAADGLDAFGDGTSRGKLVVAIGS